MASPPLKKACFCIPLRLAAQIIGLISIVFTLWLMYLLYDLVNQNPRTTFEDYLEFVFLSGYILTSLGLIVGAQLYKRWIILIWMIYAASFGVAFVIAEIVLNWNTPFVFIYSAIGIGVLVIKAYFWICVLSLYIMIDQQTVRHNNQSNQQLHNHHHHHHHLHQHHKHDEANGHQEQVFIENKN